MYSSLKSIQILISLLKQNSVKHIVLSPGGSSIPLIRSFEYDEDFKCYSVVDESVAPYFAIGIAQETGTQVAIVCTSGTAASNYVAGVAKAYESNIPIIVITADRDEYLLNQLETQKIDQMVLFKKTTLCSVSLPIVLNERDFVYCERIVNMAMIKSKKGGPVHINVPTHGADSKCVIEKLPQVRNINLININNNSIWESCLARLKSCKKIMVICGQSSGYSSEELQNMEEFSNKFECVFCVDHLSNLHMSNVVHSYPIFETVLENKLDELLPELVISFGNNLAGEKIKKILRNNRTRIEHWIISADGLMQDTYYALSAIFKCTSDFFFNKMVSGVEQCELNKENEYLKIWKKYEKKMKIVNLPFSNFLVAKEFVEIVPEGAVVHTAILNSTRQTQFFRFREGVKVFSNVGALGIDGCASTTIGLSSVNKMTFLLIGDLSFFYDVNFSQLGAINNNLRIVLVNNGAGAEFHFGTPKLNMPLIDKHVAAGHDKSPKRYFEEIGFKYLQAKDEESLHSNMKLLVEETEEPIILEVFTDAEEDGKVTRRVYNMLSEQSLVKRTKGIIENIMRRCVKEKTLAKIYRRVKL